MEKKALTTKQQIVYDFLKEESKKRGYPPSIREICDHIGLSSPATVQVHLKTLEKKGYISRERFKNRTIEIIDSTNTAVKSEYVDVPIIGKVTAGEPILAVENFNGYFPIPVDLLGNYDCFMLTVSGDSMVGAGIFEGDLILVRKQPSAENGDIIVALLDDSATVKRFYREKNAIRLHPENPKYVDILSNNVQIIGKVVGLYRQIK